MLLMDNNLGRRRIAKYSVLSIACSALLTVYFGYSLVGCLAGCKSSILEELLFGAMVLIGFTGIAVALFNFCYQFNRYRWQGLLIWEKLVLYLLVLFIVGYFGVHFYFS